MMGGEVERSVRKAVESITEGETPDSTKLYSKRSWNQSNMKPTFT